MLKAERMGGQMAELMAVPMAAALVAALVVPTAARMALSRVLCWAAE